jgi:hypothetical protein
MVAGAPEGIVLVPVVVEPIQVDVPIRKVEIRYTLVAVVVAEAGTKHAKPSKPPLFDYSHS